MGQSLSPKNYDAEPSECVAAYFHGCLIALVRIDERKISPIRVFNLDERKDLPASLIALPKAALFILFSSLYPISFTFFDATYSFQYFRVGRRDVIYSLTLSLLQFSLDKCSTQKSIKSSLLL